jgi:hypothetical protein
LTVVLANAYMDKESYELDACRVMTHVSAGTTALMLEGGNVWVANFGSRTVTKLRASDGVQLGTFGVASP